MADFEGVDAPEVMRALDDFRRESRASFLAVRNDIASLDNVSHDKYSTDMASVHRRLGDLEGSRRWIARTTGGLALGQVVVLIFALAQTNLGG